MILAAACADGGDAPRELELVWQHDRWGGLPNGGGLLDQPAGLLMRMRAAENVYRALTLYRTNGPPPGEMATWCEAHTDVWRIVQQVQALREGEDQPRPYG